MPTIVRYDTLASEIIHEPETIVVNEEYIDKKQVYLDDKLIIIVEKKNSDEKPKTS
tara:strand:+ start:167 stop:334 length:168 start_codon:yes stop_codon:yes gene_type:complete